MTGQPEGHVDQVADVHSWDVPLSQRPPTPLDEYKTGGYFG